MKKINILRVQQGQASVAEQRRVQYILLIVGYKINIIVISIG